MTEITRFLNTFFLLLSLSSCASFIGGDDKLYTGYDLNGKSRSCRKMSKDKVCTRVHTASDNHAYQCRMTGGVAIQCNCHEWICL